MHTAKHLSGNSFLCPDGLQSSSSVWAPQYRHWKESTFSKLKKKSEFSTEIHRQNRADYGVMMAHQQIISKWCCEFLEERTDIHDE